MNNVRITPKGVKREALGLLNNTWSRALATVCTAAFVLLLFVQMNQLITALLVETGMAGGAPEGAFTLEGLRQAYLSYSRGGAPYELVVPLALLVFYVLLVSPLKLGTARWYRSLVQCDSLQVGQIFRYYRSNRAFAGAVGLNVCLTGIKLLLGLVCFAPSAVCFGMAFGTWMDAPEARSTIIALLIGGGALLIVGTLVFAVLSLRFFIAKYLYVGEYGYGVTDCLRYSVRHMKGCVGGVLGVIVSFAGWFLLCVFIIPLVFVAPYFSAAMAACAQDIMDEKMGETLERLRPTNR